MKPRVIICQILSLLTLLIATVTCTIDMEEVEFSNFQFPGSWEVTGLSKILPGNYRGYKESYLELSESGKLTLILVYTKEKYEVYTGTWNLYGTQLKLHLPELLEQQYKVHLESCNAFELVKELIGELFFARIRDSYLNKYRTSENFTDNNDNLNNSEDENNDEEKDNEGSSDIPSITVSQNTVNFGYKGGESLPINITTNAIFRVTTSESWISYKLSDKTIVILVNKNTGAQRSGKVILSLQGFDDMAEITVSQDEAPDTSVVNLGLPSGTKWCISNLGASSIEEFGSYYSWRNAKANIPKGYEMPSRDQAYELINNCSWTWTTVNSVKGYLGTGRNGNTIFLPAGGYKDQWVYNGKLVYVDNVGEFWVNYDNTSPYNNYETANIIKFMNSAGVPPKISGENQLNRLNVRCVKK